MLVCHRCWSAFATSLAIFGNRVPGSIEMGEHKGADHYCKYGEPHHEGASACRVALRFLVFLPWTLLIVGRIPPAASLPGGLFMCQSELQRRNTSENKGVTIPKFALAGDSSTINR